MLKFSQNKNVIRWRTWYIYFFLLFDIYINWFQKRALNVKCDNFIIINILRDAMKKLSQIYYMRRRREDDCDYIYRCDA